MLTFKEVKTRSVILTLKRPIKAKIAYIKKWPILLVDLYTNEGIVGRSYLQPYIDKDQPSLPIQSTSRKKVCCRADYKGSYPA